MRALRKRKRTTSTTTSSTTIHKTDCDDQYHECNHGQENQPPHSADAISALKEILSLPMPRCCICDLDWYDDDDDDDEVILCNPANDAKNDEDTLRVKCHKLVPLPDCQCVTVLLANNPIQNNETESLSKILHMDDIHQVANFLIQHYCTTMPHRQTARKRQGQRQRQSQNPHTQTNHVKRYTKKAMCRACLQNFISTSNHVIQYDYKSSTQPNINFSVGGKCTCCSTKYTNRALNSLLNFDGSGDNSGSGRSTSSGSGKSSSSRTVWVEDVMATIEFVRFIKKVKRLCRKHMHESDTGTGFAGVEDVFKVMKDWLYDEEEHLSDYCFSDVEVEEKEEDNKESHCNRNQGKHTAPRRGHVELQTGELKKDLIRKDPKFRQEIEDEEYIRQMTRTKEGRVELGIEDEDGHDLGRDERLARELAREEEEELVKRRRGIGGVRRRVSDRLKSPLFKYFKGAGRSAGEDADVGASASANVEKEEDKSPKQTSWARNSFRRKKQKLMNNIRNYMTDIGRKKVSVSSSDESDSDESVQVLSSIGDNNGRNGNGMKDVRSGQSPERRLRRRKSSDAIEITDSFDNTVDGIDVVGKDEDQLEQLPYSKDVESVNESTGNNNAHEMIPKGQRHSQNPDAIEILDITDLGDKHKDADKKHATVQTSTNTIVILDSTRKKHTGKGQPSPNAIEILDSDSDNDAPSPKESPIRVRVSRRTKGNHDIKAKDTCRSGPHTSPARICLYSSPQASPSKSLSDGCSTPRLSNANVVNDDSDTKSRASPRQEKAQSFKGAQKNMNSLTPGTNEPKSFDIGPTLALIKVNAPTVRETANTPDLLVHIKGKPEESDLSNMMAFGFSREESLRAMNEANNDVTLATNNLLNERLSGNWQK